MSRLRNSTSAWGHRALAGDSWGQGSDSKEGDAVTHRPNYTLSAAARGGELEGALSWLLLAREPPCCIQGQVWGKKKRKCDTIDRSGGWFLVSSTLRSLNETGHAASCGFGAKVNSISFHILFPVYFSAHISVRGPLVGENTDVAKFLNTSQHLQHTK